MHWAWTFGVYLSNPRISCNFVSSKQVLAHQIQLGSYGFDSSRSGWGKHAVRWVISTLI